MHITTVNKHEHREETCDHDVRYCKHCDVCYCTKCQKEWKAPTTTITWGSSGTTNLGWTNTSASSTWKCTCLPDE